MALTDNVSTWKRRLKICHEIIQQHLLEKVHIVLAMYSEMGHKTVVKEDLRKHLHINHVKLKIYRLEVFITQYKT